MAMIMEADDMFNFTFHKKGGALKRAAHKKLKVLKAKIAERNKRIEKIMKEYKITDRDLLDLMSKAHNQGYQTTSNSVRRGAADATDQQIIPAGVLNNIESERTNIAAEEAHIKRMGIMIRNIETRKKFSVSYDELDFLGF